MTTTSILIGDVKSGGLAVNNSLRFRSSASAYLNRTPSVAGSRQKFTISAWLKRGTNPSTGQILMAAGTGTLNQDCYLCFGGSNTTGGTADTLCFFSPPAGNNISLLSTALYRDFSAWYHIVVAVDTTQATASNRVLMYVNGVQITSFTTATYPTLNQNLNFNNTTAENIGASTVTPANFFDGYLAEFNFVDGQALTPSSFGAYDTNGVWQPAKYAGTYGTNGFYLPFSLNNPSTYSAAFASGQQVAIPANAAFNFGTGNVTIEAWINPTTYAASPIIYDQISTGSGSYVTGQIQFGINTSGVYFQYVTGASTTASIASTVQPLLNQWSHVAAVRNGTTITIYLNGVAVASGTYSGQLGVTSNGTAIGNRANFNNEPFGGSISNFRITNTAVYASNFIPPGANLTAVTGTALLTLQNATLVDNSSNAFTLTNTGTVVLSSATPFGIPDIAADYSVNANNWTPNNISLTAGSTYDSMTDSPTVTSASVANYATLNATVPSSYSGTLSNGNLNFSQPVGATNTVSTVVPTSGKWYFEAAWTGGNFCEIGIIPAATAGTSSGVSATNCVVMELQTGAILKANVNQQTVSLYAATTDICGVAFDCSAGTIQFYKNGSTNGTAVSVTAGSYAAFVSNGSGAQTNTGFVNFGQRGFTYTPPTGFNALNTYNLPAPAIAAGAPYMNAITYTGYSNLVPAGLGQLTKRNAGSRLVSNSLRSRSSATAYLNRTFAAAPTVRTKQTFSVWVKRGILGTAQRIIDCYDGTSTASQFLAFTASDTIEFDFGGSAANALITNQVFRDPSAWYHIVISLDTTQATAANRVTMYVNGVQITSFGTANYPAQNALSQWTINTANNRIMSQWNGAPYFDGYTAETNFIDGTAYPASSFGTTNSDGIWVPIAFAGTYGTNGFYLPFTQSSAFSYAANVNNTSATTVTAPSNAAFAIGTNAFTVETWFYPLNSSFPSGAEFLYIASGGIQMGFQTSTSWGLAQSNIAWILNTSTLPTVGQWNHMAIVRSGVGVNQTAIFLNGVRVAQGTIATTFTQNTCVFGSNLNGYMSNLRLVNGTAIYNPASSTITVPTTPLTNVANTSLLTFQNATMVDNSSNAFTLTTVGSVPLSGSYPFNLLGTGIANDSSGNANNWTANNISTVQDTTYDTMIDSPTDYASAGNYSVLNPLNWNSSYISNGNLYYGGVSNNTNATGTFQLPTSGKWYWELTPTDSSPNYISPAVGQVGTITSGSNAGNTSSGVWGLYPTATLYLAINGAATNSGISTPGLGIVFAVAYDAGSGKLWFGYSSAGAIVWFNSSAGTTGNPATGANPVATLSASNSYVPMVTSNTNTSTNKSAINFGQQPFIYTPPTGFVALNTYNLPTPTTSWFTTANNSVAGNTTAYPDLVWAKARSSAQNHSLTDTLRGPTLNLIANTTGVEAGLSTLFAVNKYGLTLGNDVSVNSSGYTDVVWGWQAGQSTSATNSNGSITSTVSANTTAGFSVVTYTGTGANATVGHGLGVAPSMIIVKARSIVENWPTWHTSLTSAAYVLTLNTTNAQASVPTVFNSTLPTSSVFSIGTSTGSGGSGTTYVAYCWAAVAGYSAFGSYTGNGSTDGPFVYTGFRPRWILLKNSASATAWFMFDSSRDTYNVVGQYIQAQSNTTEATQASVDFLSNGFKLRVATDPNAAASYIYAAFAENPFNSSRAR